MSKKLFLIDGSALYYRSYFAFIRNPLINSKGENTSATFGFLNTMLKLLEDEHPEYVAIVFDTSEPTFRHKMYADYKATREKMPDEMRAQYPRLVNTLKALNFHLLELDGYEADDIIGTLAVRFADDDLNAYIVSGDKDMAQLVNGNVYLYASGKSGNPPDILDAEKVSEKYGVKPSQIRDWLALMGDSSDNIPGVPKVGQKTAAKLLEDFESLEKIYDNIDEVKGKLQENLKENKEQAFVSRELTTIKTDVPIEVKLDEITFDVWDMKVADKLLRELEFRSLFNRMLALSEDKEAPADDLQDIESSDSKYVLVEERETLQDVAGKIKKAGRFVYDIETDTLDEISAELAGIALSWEAGKACYIPLNHPDIKLDQETVFKILQPLFKNKDIKKIGQNLKYDTAILRRQGLEIDHLYFDTMVASYVIDPSNRQHNLGHLAEKYMAYRMIPIEELIGSGRNQKKMTDIPAADVLNYAAEDADITLQIAEILEKKIQENGQDDLMYKLEMPLVEVLMTMETHGIKVDLDLLEKLSAEMGDEAERLQKEIHEIGGEEFNISSPQQLGTILFEKLKIHEDLGLRRPKRTKSGQISTSEQILERYSEHPAIAKILHFRKLTKLKNTYIDAFPNLLNPKTERIHTSFNQTVAATGRLSSANPNLQNIPIRTELGRAIRKAFIPSRDDYVILSADYSQVELRIMAHLSRDETLIEGFKKGDKDIHAITAALIFDIDIDEVTGDHRRKAKEINFGIMYGMNKWGLANRLHITPDEAELFIANYFATYPNIQLFMRGAIEMAKDKGYVETMLRRRRYLGEIHSRNRNIREFAERTAINTPIQGSAADLIKKAMIDVHDYIQKEKARAAMLLQVHDELVFEVHKDEIHSFSEKVRHIMSSAFELRVPLVVDCGWGDNWLEAHE